MIIKIDFVFYKSTVFFSLDDDNYTSYLSLRQTVGQPVSRRHSDFGVLKIIRCGTILYSEKQMAIII